MVCRRLRSLQDFPSSYQEDPIHKRFHVEILEKYSHPDFDIQKWNISTGFGATKPYLLYWNWPHNISDLDMDYFLKLIQLIQHLDSAPITKDNNQTPVVLCLRGSFMSAVVIAIDVAISHDQNSIKL
ncbi:hypothetical protein Ahia01_000141700 [Argonauta hians]